MHDLCGHQNKFQILIIMFYITRDILNTVFVISYNVAETRNV